ncbi:MAG: DUF86 domain-containing protein [Chloroflexi bacterium]|nr:DUF86 domain-containing protein [Ardenticatenaceae bacterium]MBL1127725.1 DUF86 domain-containing protein [Chloroflexota bacterium]NOG33791.1 DUF86 domain-containing protein [Chloroflexota bacterium]GIK54375.1 MAG: hypothetical protein BroJett015_00380 [Chloroflexota bacterium]
MTDQETVLVRLNALKNYLQELDYYAQFSLQELTADFVKYRATQHSLLLAAQAVVDIAMHIVAGDFDVSVESYRQAIVELGNKGVIGAELATRLAPFAGFRNILVHDYLVVDPVIVSEILQNGRADLREFGKQVTVYLQT